MPRRSITDEEIGLIKAMLRRGRRNRDIQFYFNRPDRPVNSGRITNIRSGDYGPEVPEATDTALDAFLAGVASAEAGVVVEGGVRAEPSLVERVRARFVQRGEGRWYLAEGESSEQECKAEFDPRRMEPIIRAIAAMANNRGGFVLIGINNEDSRVVGMSHTDFQDTDIVRITDKAKSLLTPTPIFSKDVIQLDDLVVGVIHVEKHPNPPVIVCRDANGLDEGTILFRYPGQSGKIKFGDLLEMLRQRDRAAQQELLASAFQLSEIGTEQALILDTNKGEFEAGTKHITIDRTLADQLEFIREGEFDERQGAPALRLVGNVHTVDQSGRIVERVEGRALSPNMSLHAYLDREAVRSPMEYVCLCALVQRQWLPLFYFVQLAGVQRSVAISALDGTAAVYRISKQKALKRLRGELSAFSKPSRSVLKVVEALQGNYVPDLRDRFTDAQLVRGIQGLPDRVKPAAAHFDILKEIDGDAGDNSSLRSNVFRAAARLDELEEQAQRK